MAIMRQQPGAAPENPAGAAGALALVGPTACGKSALAMQLAEHLPLEIISLDSAQVFRGMNVGTAKPRAAERAQVPHHLLDIIDPTESYSAARFRSDALRLMNEIRARGRLPLLVGGTMLYLKALREGLSDLPQADATLRAELDADAAQLGWSAMHARLAQLDPITAARLQPGDSQRIQRALEICLVSGEPMSMLLARSANPLGADPDANEAQKAQEAQAAVSLRVLALEPSDRAVLHQAIARRFDRMLQDGLVEELRALRLAHPALHAGLPSMRCVGYRQAWQFLDGELSADELALRGLYATRQLAKRQLTWLRSMRDVTRLDSLAPDLLRQALHALA
jgi:tRNA dimethylallyltransferase